MLFIDAKSNVDKEALRQHVLTELESYLVRAEAVIHGEQEQHYWHAVHNLIGLINNSQERGKWLKAELQLVNLDQFIKGWLSTAVESSERFEFFILSKAEEIASGDQQHDYFWALQIRHDQLVALVDVTDQWLIKMEKMVKKAPKSALTSSGLKPLIQRPIEEEIYLKAEEINQERKKLAKL